MNQSKTGLKNFNQWVSSIRYAINHLEKYKVKRDFYEMKLLSCRTMRYEPFIGKTQTNAEDKLMYWIIKIDEVETIINQMTKLIKAYKAFLNHLSQVESIVLNELINNSKSIVMIAKEMEVSRNRVYEIINKLKRKYTD